MRLSHSATLDHGVTAPGEVCERAAVWDGAATVATGEGVAHPQNRENRLIRTIKPTAGLLGALDFSGISGTSYKM